MNILSPTKGEPGGITLADIVANKDGGNRTVGLIMRSCGAAFWIKRVMDAIVCHVPLECSDEKGCITTAS
ncbi:MAG: hypothetical protein C7B47_08415 [Sulfobacillus thermosulfidooxidans]|uniref:Uncharacterized protein n=1 Tax=Sulfobacillus thermosulfidooxidans TaxID=28034 RepID=A0A2T2WYT2_SULTH|nr:MAG: hypothetical protein C7B47_08415 [Sulfobacillus thermosulfidooxidans]